MSQEPALPLIELGIITAGTLDRIDRQAVEDAIGQLTQRLVTMESDYLWQLPRIRRDEWVEVPRVEPVELLAQAREERDIQGWDFAVVITSADLVSHYKPFSYAVISRSLDVAVISTSRIDPRAVDEAVATDRRQALLCERIEHLTLHALGHWSGLGHHSDPRNLMHDILSVEDIGAAYDLTEAQRKTMSSKFSLTADQRLEERADVNQSKTLGFAVRASWENRNEILAAVMQAKPWQFPTRLSKFAAAAISTVLVLLMTAETWDMAMSQSFVSVLLFFSLALAVTTAYICIRQQLLVRRNSRPLTEQIVATNLSAVLIVIGGIVTMFGILFLLGMLASLLLFPAAVASSWASSLPGPISASNYVLLAGTVSSLGILIGALGASFEDQHYFRHVIFVDEEI